LLIVCGDGLFVHTYLRHSHLIAHQLGYHQTIFVVATAVAYFIIVLCRFVDNTTCFKNCCWLFGNHCYLLWNDCLPNVAAVDSK